MNRDVFFKKVVEINKNLKASVTYKGKQYILNIMEFDDNGKFKGFKSRTPLNSYEENYSVDLHKRFTNTLRELVVRPDWKYRLEMLAG